MAHGTRRIGVIVHSAPRAGHDWLVRVLLAARARPDNNEVSWHFVSGSGKQSSRVV